jgi:hypothetical protein
MRKVGIEGRIKSKAGLADVFSWGILFLQHVYFFSKNS